MQGKSISIHAPAKGATCRQACQPARARHFNPRSREGSDRLDLGYMLRRLISIHAPAKGATSLPPYTDTFAVFQSTLPRRERPRYLLIRIRSQYFNPRSREGSDPSVASTPATNGYFNPRSREGSDIRQQHYCKHARISIHAPAKGATCALHSVYLVTVHFNPRSREGSDLLA